MHNLNGGYLYALHYALTHMRVLNAKNNKIK